MVKRRRLFVIVAVITICLWVGFRSGSLAKGGSNLGLLPGVFIPASSGDDVGPLEIKTLLIDVDKLTEPSQANLNSVWLMVKHPSLEKVYWFPLYQLKDTNKEHAQVAESFQLGMDKKPRDSFLIELQKEYRIEWNTLLILDQNDWVQTVASLEGVRIDGNWIKGDQVLQYNLFEKSPEPLANQAKLMRAICDRRNEVISYPNNFASTLDRLTERLLPASETTPSEFNSLVIQFKSLWMQPQALRCEFVGVK